MRDSLLGCCKPHSIWCTLDTVQHRLHTRWDWLCDKHDEVITGDTTKYRPVAPRA